MNATVRVGEGFCLKEWAMSQGGGCKNVFQQQKNAKTNYVS